MLVIGLAGCRWGSLPAGGKGGGMGGAALWSCRLLDQAGSLNASPLVSTAHAMRAFLAAIATTAFQ
jgi:hypothetical protein